MKKIKLLGKYEAEIADLSPQLALPPWHSDNRINVWLTLSQSVGSCLAFGVDIKAKDYTEEEFLKVVQVEADLALENIINTDRDEREKSRKTDEDRKALNKLTADLGDKLGIPYALLGRR